MIRSTSSSEGTGRGRTPAVTEGDQDVEGDTADLLGLGLAQPGVRQSEEQRVGAEVVSEQREVAGQVGQRRQQWREDGLGEDAGGAPRQAL